MSIAKTLLGTSVVVPERKETGWGDNVTSILTKLIDATEATAVSVGGVIIEKSTVTTTTLAAGATLTPAARVHRIQSNGGGDVALSATTPIAPGTVDGQELVLMGAHAANTVTILDGGTVDLNGNVTLAKGESIYLIWNSGLGMWEELSRSH